MAALLFDRRQLFKLLWPLVVEQLLTVLVGVIDVFMVAYVGEATVAGVSLVDSVNYLFIQVLFALTAGGTVVCAQFVGAQDLSDVGRSCANLMLVTVSGMTVVSLVLVLGGPQILSAIFGSVSEDIMENALIYLNFTASSLPFMALFYSVAAAFRANGETRLSMTASLLMNFINVVGNAVCIFGLHMGVVGVALPTLLSRIAASAFMLWLFQRPTNKVRFTSLRQFKPDWQIVKRILSIGVPGGVESGLFNVGKVLLQSLVSTLGTASIAAYAVASSLVTFLYLPGNALGVGLMTIVGQCEGMGDRAQGRRYAKKLLGLNYVMVAFVGAALAFGIGFWIGLYNLSPEASALAAQLVVAHSIAMAIWPPAFLLPSYFRSVNRATFPLVVAIATMVVVRVGLAYLFVGYFGLGLIWVWYAMFADWAVRLVVFLIAFHRMGRAPMHAVEREG